MSRRLALGLLLLLPAAALGWAPPATAATPSGRWTDPAPVGTFEDVPLAYQQSSGPLRGFAEFDGEIQGVAFTLVRDGAETPDDPCSASQAVQPQTAPGGNRRVEWAFDAPFPCNRRYQVRATVTPRPRTLQQDTPLVLNLWVHVALPPVPLGEVAADVGEDRSVRLRWDEPGQAPDFEGYQVRRAVEDGEASPIGEVGPDVGTFVDADLPESGGTLRYEVLGMRPGPEGTTVFSAPGVAVATVEPVRPAGSSTTVPGDGGTGSVTGTTVSRGEGPTRVRQVFQAPSPRRAPVRTRTTVDTGFQQTLPFAPGDPAGPEQEPEQQEAMPAGDPAVVARIDDDGDSGQRDTMLLVAGGAAALSWALLLRVISRRAVLL